MVDILRSAASGLLASQRMLATTGHNIANANNPDYSRQRVELATRLAQPQSGYYLGRGVDVASVGRVYDEFLTQQVRSHSTGLSRLETLNALIGQVGSLLGDGETGLAADLRQFFGAVQDVADAPASAPARQVMLSQGETLAARFQHMARQLDDIRNDLNQDLRRSVGEINQLAEAIAVANRDIIVAQGSVGGTPNDLLDHRDKLLAQLSRQLAVQTVVQSDGAVSVFVGSGQALVVGGDVNRLEVVTSVSDPRDVEIRYQGAAASADISAYLQGGQVGAYLEFRREVLDATQNKLGLLAVGLAETFNAQHRQGMDLDGQPGGDFFRVGAPRVLANVNNAGTATLAVGIAEVGQFNGSDYELRYDGANFSLRRLADNQIVAGGPAGPFTVDGLSIELSGGTAVAGDRFLIQPTRQAATGFAVVVANAREIAAAAPVRTAAGAGNLGSAAVSAGVILDVADPNLRRDVEIRFSSPTAFDVVDTATGVALATDQPYASGDAIAFNGWEVRISGSPQAGDTFQVTDNAGGVGDNRNALALAGLQSRLTLLGGSNNYQDVYAQLVGKVGNQGRHTQNVLKSQEALMAQVTRAREAVSGVNLDEEAADLMRFQQAYAAAAQVIRAANTLFETLLGAVRS